MRNDLTIRVIFGATESDKCAKCGAILGPGHYVLTDPNGGRVCDKCGEDIAPEMLAACEALSFLARSHTGACVARVFRAIVDMPAEMLPEFVGQADAEAACMRTRKPTWRADLEREYAAQQARKARAAGRPGGF